MGGARMAKIYTKTGDDGSTGLGDGSRVSKDDARVAATGDIDELNAAIGAALAFVSDAKVKSLLASIQPDLFALGAQLSNPKYDAAKAKGKTKLDDARLKEFEDAIDAWTATLPPLRGFIMPAGSKGGALLHLARTVCRRAERSVIALRKSTHVPPPAVKVLNRLGDLLFVTARVENQKQGEPQVDWT